MISKGIIVFVFTKIYTIIQILIIITESKELLTIVLRKD